jgi:plasmid maintenance system antidote protein VapI
VTSQPITAEVLGVRRATLSDRGNEKASLAPEMALRIEKAFGVSMGTLVRMRARHDGYTMRPREGEAFPGHQHDRHASLGSLDPAASRPECASSALLPK